MSYSLGCITENETSMANQPLLYTLNIRLEPLHFNPPIWRRIRVSGDCTLRRLHRFIQAAFGWSSSHL